MKRILSPLTPALALGLWFFAATAAPAQDSHVKVLFLGDAASHHKPADRFAQLQPVLAARGIDLVYTDKLDDLNPAKLAQFDVLAIYGNQTRIEPAQEKAMLDYVASGHGLVPIHCASACFGNSKAYIDLVGGRFKSHKTGVFKDTVVNAAHPVMNGLKPIESWDETYVHDMHNPDKIVLAERCEPGQPNEPWTWVRTQGKGRIFYTAWGHDERTWGNPGFVALLENGIRWAAGAALAATPDLKAKTGLKPFEYQTADLPFYDPHPQEPGERVGKWTQMQKPLSPEESAQHIVTLPGFTAKLFAAEPEIWKPICLAFDERGRLWVAETIDYPNELKPENEGRDRIVILEDTNGDGKMDRQTVFADKLSIPTSIAFANGGIIVQQAPNTLFLKSSKGDDHADIRKVLFQGWGTSDTHAGPSSLRYGFDNYIWGSVGYSGFDGLAGGKSWKFAMGFYRFKPDGSDFEFLRSTNNNTWGAGFDEAGTVFGSTANGNAVDYMPLANRYYESVSGWAPTRLGTIADSQKIFPITEKVRQVDQHGNYTAGAGLTVYTARNFPREYWNRIAFVNEPTGHVVGMFSLEPRGADFVAHNQKSFLASDDEWTAPIAAEVGPDGALWVIDWYNYIIQHNPTPPGFKTGARGAYETPIRDKTHGRIYRVVWNNAKPVPRFDLSKATPAQLVAMLKNDNLLWRSHAQRLLVERNKTDVVPALAALAKDPAVDELGLNVGAVHALWTLHGLGAFREGGTGFQPVIDPQHRLEAGATLLADLKHPSAAVRRAAIQVLPKTAASFNAIVSNKLTTDPDAQVRLAALLAIADAPASEAAGQAIFAALEDKRNNEDHWIVDAATSAAAKNDAAFLKSVLSKSSTKLEEKTAAPVNLLPNDSFESETAGKPLDWESRNYNGAAEFALADEAHSGRHSVKVSSAKGADSGWMAHIKVQPSTTYHLSGWVKTDNVKGAVGALMNVHELQGVKTNAVNGTSDWKKVETTFQSGGASSLTINCLFGGWGQSTGAAWFDDVRLEQASGVPGGLPGEAAQVVRIVTGHYAERAPADSIVPLLLALNGSSPAVARPILDGLSQHWPQGKAPEISAEGAKQLIALYDSLDGETRGALIALADRWGRGELFASKMAGAVGTLGEKLADAKAPVAERAEAARKLVTLQDGIPSAEAILAQVSPQADPTLVEALLGALAESKNAQTASALIMHWPKLAAGSRRNAVGVLLRRPDWTNALLAAVQKKEVAYNDIAADQWVQMEKNPDKNVGKLAHDLKKPTSSSAELAAVSKKLLPLADQKGDAAHGKVLFETACIVCHTIDGKGAKIGPDLTGIGARPRQDNLLDIIDPNRSVEANFRMWTVTTKSGDTFAGRLDTESQTTVEILDTTGQKHIIQRRDIEAMETTGQSIMPVGFDQLPPDDLKAILEYLALSNKKP